MQALKPPSKELISWMKTTMYHIILSMFSIDKAPTIRPGHDPIKVLANMHCTRSIRPRLIRPRILAFQRSIPTAEQGLTQILETVVDVIVGVNMNMFMRMMMMVRMCVVTGIVCVQISWRLGCC